MVSSEEAHFVTLYDLEAVTECHPEREPNISNGANLGA